MQETDSLFEALPLTRPEAAPKRRRTVTLSLSLAAHAAAIGAMVILPLMTSEIPSDLATSAVHAFFVQPAAAAPPPPPPPAKVTAGHLEPKAAPPKDVTFSAPLETPNQVAPEKSGDLVLEGTVAGGVEGGVPAGVLGGVVGGLPDPPPPPRPVRVGGSIKEPKKLKHVDPVYPQLAVASRVQGVVVLECTLSPDGRVAELKIVRSIPLLDAAAIQAVRQWVFTPTLFNGVPVPAVMMVNVRFAL